MSISRILYPLLNK